MPVKELIKIVKPPECPFEVGTISEWQAVERQLGVVLPSDYREFVFTYGSGLFAQFYRIYNPFSVSEYTALYTSVKRVCGHEQEFKRD